MRRFLAFAAITALVGCATTATDLQDRTPNGIYQTTHSSAEVVRCLTDHIRNYGQPGVISDTSETTLTFVERDAATLVWSIKPDGQVRVWRLHGLVPYREAASRCL